MSNEEKLIGEKLYEARKEGVAEAHDPHVMFDWVELLRLRASREQFDALKKSRLKKWNFPQVLQ